MTKVKCTKHIRTSAHCSFRGGTVSRDDMALASYVTLIYSDNINILVFKVFHLGHIYPMVETLGYHCTQTRLVSIRENWCNV